MCEIQWWRRHLLPLLSGASTVPSRDTKSACNTEGADGVADKEASDRVEVGIAIHHRALLLGPGPFGEVVFAMN